MSDSASCRGEPHGGFCSFHSLKYVFSSINAAKQLKRIKEGRRSSGWVGFGLEQGVVIVNVRVGFTYSSWVVSCLSRVSFP